MENENKEAKQVQVIEEETNEQKNPRTIVDEKSLAHRMWQTLEKNEQGKKNKQTHTPTLLVNRVLIRLRTKGDTMTDQTPNKASTLRVAPVVCGTSRIAKFSPPVRLVPYGRSWMIFVFLVSRKFHGNAKKMWWVLLLSPGVTFREVAKLGQLIASSKILLRVLRPSASSCP